MDKVDDKFNCLEGKSWNVWTMMEKLWNVCCFLEIVIQDVSSALFNYEVISKKNSYSLCSHAFLIITILL